MIFVLNSGMEEGRWHAFLCRNLYLSLIQIKSKLVRNVMALIREGVRAAASILVKPFEFCACARVCERHCLCFTYLWQMLAEWNWIPGTEREEITPRILFYVWGQDFSWPALIPWLCAPWKPAGEWRRRSGVKRALFPELRGPRSHMPVRWFDSKHTKQSGNEANSARSELIIWAAIQISCFDSSVGNSNNWWVRHSSSSLNVKHSNTHFMVSYFCPPPQHYQAGLVNLFER